MFRQAYGTHFQISKAKAYIEKSMVRLSYKADGLALGKGVVVAETVEQAVEAAHEMLLDTINLVTQVRAWFEEFLVKERNFHFAFVSMVISYITCQRQDPTNVSTMVTGGNTGGMGAYVRQPHLLQRVVDTAVDTILKPQF